MNRLARDYLSKNNVLVSRKLAFHLCTCLPDGSLSDTVYRLVPGEPLIECLEDEIRFSIKSQKLFGGRMYAKGKAEDAQCVSAGFGPTRTSDPMLALPLGVCGMISLRSVFFGNITVFTLFLTDRMFK